jgi:hypothetical protein
MYQFNNSLNDLDGYISTVIQTMIVPPPSGATLQTLVTAVRTAAYTGAPNLPFSPESIRAAVNTVALDQSLTTRDGLLEDLRARVEALESA